MSGQVCRLIERRAMARYHLTIFGSPTGVLLLNPGSNRLGRDPANDIRILDPTVSSFHSEILVSGDSVLVRDLGSTNGTFIDDDLIQERDFKIGQTLQMGAVRLLLETEAELASVRITIPELNLPKPPPAASFLPDGSSACLRHPGVPAIFECTTCHYTFCEECIRTVGLAGGKTMHFCVNCDGHCRPVTPPVAVAAMPAATSKGKSFFGRLTQTLRLPFKR